MRKFILFIIVLGMTQVWRGLPARATFSAGASWQSAPPSRRIGSISGRVITDDGSLASGALINLTSVGVSNFGSAQGSVADEEGNFTVNNLEARVYRVYASLPGYVSAGEDDPWRQARIGDTVTVNLVKGGVITGKVTTPSGDPVIGLSVSVTRVRDAEGKPVLGMGTFFRPAQTDDRGQYRMYGLSAGSYVVVANASSNSFSVTPYSGDKPVYHPSNSRETAAEVQVQPGAIASGIDIRFRNEPGNTISGKVLGAAASGEMGNHSVALSIPGTALRIAQVSVQNANSFEMHGIADGDYEIMAYRYGQLGVPLARSAPRRIRVRNGDLGGIELALVSLSSISGTVALEPLPELKPEEKNLCVKGRPAALHEVLLKAQLAPSANAGNALTVFSLNGVEAAPDEKGAFNLAGLEAGQYGLHANLPGEGWYVKGLTTSQPAAAAKRAPASNAGLLAVKAGETLSGVTLTLAEGAAHLSGKIEGKTSGRLRVHLVPADAALANDVLRYRETLARSDGSFAFKSLAPGKYWVLTKPLAADESAEATKAPLAWDATARAALRKAAEASPQTVELGTCMRLSGYKLKP